MFQDIGPHRLYNEYTLKRPAKADDVLIVCQKGRVLLKKAGEALVREVNGSPSQGKAPSGQGEDRPSQSKAPSGQGEDRLPRCGDFPEVLADAEKLQYLIEVDETAFYLWKGSAKEERPDVAENGNAKERLSDAGKESYCAIRFSVERFGFEPLSTLRRLKPQELAYGAVTACHLADWYDKNRYCGRCAQAMTPDEKERAMRCPVCGNIVYPRISPGIIVRVTDGDRILLTKYAGREFTNYALVAGFTEIGETLEETVRREVMEEVGLKVKNIRYYTNQPWGFSQSLLVGFYAELDGDAAITLEQDELSVGVWMTREEMPSRADDISMTARMMENFRLGLD